MTTPGSNPRPPALNDQEVSVAWAAYAALKSLTGQDFGPARDASADDKAEAIKKWREWWAEQEGR